MSSPRERVRSGLLVARYREELILGTTIDDLLGSIQQSFGLPLRAVTTLPAKSTDVAELAAALALAIEGQLYAPIVTEGLSTLTVMWLQP